MAAHIRISNTPENRQFIRRMRVRSPYELFLPFFPGAQATVEDTRFKIVRGLKINMPSDIYVLSRNTINLCADIFSITTITLRDNSTMTHTHTTNVIILQLLLYCNPQYLKGQRSSSFIFHPLSFS